MYSQESLQSNEVARAPVKGTIPVGHKLFTMTPDEADKSLKNPVPVSRDSAWRGRRLYNANCLTCHGKKGDGKGPVGASGAFTVPSLLDDAFKSKSDGRMFAVIHLGGAIMPRYGFKFSEREHWDVINYVRFLQGVKDVPGLNRPE